MKRRLAQLVARPGRDDLTLSTLVSSRNTDRAHIRIREQAVCGRCEAKPCIVCCPAGCWQLAEGKVDVIVDGCLECGTCRVVCAPGNVDWDYPRGGFGILFKFG